MVERFVQIRGGYRVFEPAKLVVDPFALVDLTRLAFGIKYHFWWKRGGPMTWRRYEQSTRLMSKPR